MDTLNLTDLLRDFAQTSRAEFKRRQKDGRHKIKMHVLLLRALAGILGKLLGLRLSGTRHHYPKRTAGDPCVYYTDCSFLVGTGPWKGYRVYWNGIFNDAPGQKCHVRETEDTNTYLSIQCDVA